MNGSAPAGDTRPTVFATVGTDHHQFDRLIAWVDRWVQANAEAVTGLIQIGTSTRPRYAGSATYLGYEEMETAMRRAVAVVTHGGPGSIMLCSSLGKTPIVVPRQAALGEHVDDHQVLFTARLAAAGTIELARSEAHLATLLTAALDGVASATGPRERSHVGEAVRRFERLVGEILGDGGDAPVGAGAPGSARA